ncbi:helix-turn-helix domain-containing protein [Erythrobacter dokdonensis]|uniref:DNA binding domain protein, excisionase family n=1 Tax=Erythrobacter dokdonensis DSW-74 TaxID=1300349 RepID=A0A1A7BGJ6_9SPHN|nr:helix-turn-helix domain-containing protein [Erythrobacter dokdonensis]OBV10542.1 DNA binding domain protein, excisionase family [Erythrobacter dokdonensis DSW-74]
MATNDDKLAYSIKEACKATSLSKTTIYAYIASKKLRVVRIGGRTVIPAESLRELVTGRSAG